MAGPTQLYDRDSQKWVDVPDHEITPAVSSGRFGFAEGIDVPVVSPDGQLGYVPSDKAEEAFTKHGFRWQTSADQESYTQQEQQKIKQDAFGNSPALAGLTGLARGATFGTSDIGLRKLGLAEAAKNLEEKNSIASGIGEAVGTVVSPVGELGGAIRGAVAGAKALKVGAEASKAAQVISKYAGAGLGSAVEGAYYGLGHGISETALGDPSEVAQNIGAGVGYGALFGGMLGAGFQGISDAAPIVKEIARRTTNLFDQGIQKASRAGYEKTIVPVMMSRGEAALAQKFGDLAADPELRQAMDRVGPAKFEDAVREAKTAEAELARQAKDLHKGLNSYIERYPAQEKAAISSAIESSKGDVSKALDLMHSQIAETNSNFDNAILGLGASDGRIPNRLFEDTESLIKKLDRSGDPASQTLGGRLSDILKFERRPEFSVADEVNLAKRLREEIPSNADKFTKASKPLLSKYAENIQDFALDNHPNPFVADNQKILDTQMKAYDGLRDFVSSNTKKPANLINAILKDPNQTAKLDILLKNAAAFVPEISAVQSGFKDIVARQTALESMAAKANGLKDASVIGRFSPDDMQDMLKMIGGKADVVERSDRLKTISDALAANPDAGTLDRYIGIQKALGNPVNKTLEEMAKIEPGFETMTKLRAVSAKPSGSTMDKLLLPLALLGPKGAAAYKGLSSLLSVGSNPYKSMQTLTSIEKMSNKAAQSISKGVAKASDALLNPDFQRVTKAVAAEKSQTKTEQLKTFAKQQEMLTQMQDPGFAADYMSKRFGNMPGATMLQGAMVAQNLQVAQFLAQKLPAAGLNPSPFEKNKLPMISDQDLSKFNRYVKAAQNPMSIFDSIRSGSVSIEEAETVKALYPNIFKQLQDSVLNDINKYDREPSYQQKLMLGTLLDMPLDETMTPEFIASMQGDFAQEAAKQNKPGRPEGKSIKIDLKSLSNLETSTTRIANK